MACDVSCEQRIRPVCDVMNSESLLLFYFLFFVNFEIHWAINGGGGGGGVFSSHTRIWGKIF